MIWEAMQHQDRSTGADLEDADRRSSAGDHPHHESLAARSPSRKPKPELPALRRLSVRCRRCTARAVRPERKRGPSVFDLAQTEAVPGVDQLPPSEFAGLDEHDPRLRPARSPPRATRARARNRPRAGPRLQRERRRPCGSPSPRHAHPAHREDSSSPPNVAVDLLRVRLHRHAVLSACLPPARSSACNLVLIAVSHLSTRQRSPHTVASVGAVALVSAHHGPPIRPRNALCAS